jgi:hypothetical protein
MQHASIMHGQVVTNRKPLTADSVTKRS